MPTTTAPGPCRCLVHPYMDEAEQQMVIDAVREAAL